MSVSDGMPPLVDSRMANPYPSPFGGQMSMAYPSSPWVAPAQGYGSAPVSPYPYAGHAMPMSPGYIVPPMPGYGTQGAGTPYVGMGRATSNQYPQTTSASTTNDDDDDSSDWEAEDAARAAAGLPPLRYQPPQPQSPRWSSPYSTSYSLDGWRSPAADGLRRVASSTGSPSFVSGPRPRHQRPEDWRSEFRMPRSGFSRLFSFKKSSAKENTLTRNFRSYFGVLQLHWLLEYKTPPICMWDIRRPPDVFEVVEEGRALTQLELQEAATEPPTSRMRLVHPLLPWYLIIEAAPNTIITISHLLWTLHLELRRQIANADFWNDEVDEIDRRRIRDAWALRCAGDEHEANQGVRRVDFLGDTFLFVGLRKRDDEWEIRVKRQRDFRQ